MERFAAPFYKRHNAKTRQAESIESSRMAFKCFLSHRYKSADVNLYFFDVFARHSEVQFEVDVGSAPTCVTRLERMINNSDAFIGIYPFSDDTSKVPTKDELLNASKYFRLECDLAIRAGIPGLVFHDQRFADLFKLPRHIRRESFDYQEVTGMGGSPTRKRFERIFDAFQSEVAAAIEFSSLSDRKYSKTVVGIMVPHPIGSAQGYNGSDLELIQQHLHAKGFDSIAIIPWPPVFDGNLLAALESLDFAIVDIGNEAMASGVVGFLHGRCIPCIRLLKGYTDKKVLERRTALKGLFGVVPVGYAKDIIVWKDQKTLADELNLRLDFIKAPVHRINTQQEATQYFQKAKQRNDTVFLSYSGQDYEIAAKISQELKKRFQRVFDYRDGVSITPGEPWIKEIFNKLSGSKLGIPLVSPSYLASGNCTHEAQEMIALRDADQMIVIPLKLYKEDIDRPTWMRNRQYMHFYDYPDIKTLIDMIVKFYDTGKKN